MLANIRSRNALGRGLTHGAYLSNGHFASNLTVSIQEELETAGLSRGTITRLSQKLQERVAWCLRLVQYLPRVTGSFPDRACGHLFSAAPTVQWFAMAAAQG